MFTKDFLKKEYVKKRKSAQRIAKEQKCGETTVYRYLEKYGITRRSSSESQLPEEFEEPTKEELERLHYEEHKSINEIAKIKKVSWTTIKRRFKKFGIRNKSISELRLPKNLIKPPKEELIKLIYEKNLNPPQIGKIYSVSPPTVRRWCRESGVPLKKKAIDRKPYRYWNKEKVIQEIKKINKKKGNLSARYCSLKRGSLFKAALKYFGSWEKAITEAGIDYLKIKNKYYKYICNDKTRVISIPEMQFCNWLIENKIRYEYEPIVPTKFARKGFLKPDFGIGKFYIEILGRWNNRKWGLEYQKNWNNKKNNWMKEKGTGLVVCLGDEIATHLPYFHKAKCILIGLIPKNNELKKENLSKQLSLLIPFFKEFRT